MGWIVRCKDEAGAGAWQRDDRAYVKAWAFYIEVMRVFNYRSPRWRRKEKYIKRRDGYICQWCKRYGRIREAEVVHHIKPVEDYPELAYIDDNLVSICNECHNKAHPEKGRKASARRRGIEKY